MQRNLILNTPLSLLDVQRQFVKISEIGFTFFNTKDVVRNRLVEKMINVWKDEPHEV